METLDYKIVKPNVEESLDQNQEWIYVDFGDEKKKIRFHDYGKVYEVPGLYEKIFYEELKCQSPEFLSDLLEQTLDERGERMEDLRMLDFGAGNGMVAEELKTRGTKDLVGVDIIPEAKEATERDRPDVYLDYYVMDLANWSDKEKQTLRNYDFNSLITVAALGFDDIPPRAMINAFNLVRDGGWFVCNIRDKFLSNKDNSGYHDVFEVLKGENLKIYKNQKYCHRLSMEGDELFYNAIVGKKLKSIDLDELNLPE